MHKNIYTLSEMGLLRQQDDIIHWGIMHCLKQDLWMM